VIPTPACAITQSPVGWLLTADQPEVRLGLVVARSRCHGLESSIRISDDEVASAAHSLHLDIGYCGMPAWLGTT
jgi:hypothetical protein